MGVLFARDIRDSVTTFTAQSICRHVAFLTGVTGVTDKKPCPDPESPGRAMGLWDQPTVALQVSQLQGDADAPAIRATGKPHRATERGCALQLQQPVVVSTIGPPGAREHGAGSAHD